jgi:glycosyltransferase involved in cell wall biosynthesis
LRRLSVNGDEQTPGRSDSQKPVILVLTTSYPSHDKDPSGVFIAKLLAALKNRGYTMKVVAPSDGTFHGRRVLDGIETIRFGYFFPRSLERLTRGGGGIPENLSQSFLARLQIPPMMLAFFIVSLSHIRGCDLIYANWIGAGFIGALLKLVTGKPLVVSFRGDDGYLARERLSWWVPTRIVADMADVIAPVSGELVRILVDLGVPAEKCRLPRFGVDTDMFHPALHRDLRREEVQLLFVGSLIPRKGLQDLLEALSDGPFEQVALHVVGDGFYREQLMAMCRRFGLEERTRWHGMLSPVEVGRLMRSSDVVCLPSHMEGRPNVVNEAMASGTAVIATRIGGIPDMVIEGETGLLFDAGNIEQLRQCLSTLVSDGDLRRKMGTAGREFLVNSGVSWDATAEDFDAIFSELLNKSLNESRGR